MDAKTARTAHIRRVVDGVGGPADFIRRYGTGKKWTPEQVSQWTSVKKPKPIGHKLARELEQVLGLSVGALDREDQSQAVTLTADKLGIALVAVESAIRAKGLVPEEAWGKLAPLVLWAVALQDKHYPDGVKDLRGFDAQVLLEMDRGSYGFSGDGQAAEGRVGASAKAAPARKKARAGR
jgi:hypothetical protein